MRIYSSSEYIEDPKVGDLKLRVNSIWDFGSRSVCFNRIKSFGNEDVLISYDLEECTDVRDGIIIGGTEKCKNTTWKKADISQEIVECLIKDGYSVSKSFNKLKK